MPYISGGGITEKLHGIRGFSAKKFQDIPGQNEKKIQDISDFQNAFLTGIMG